MSDLALFYRVHLFPRDIFAYAHSSAFLLSLAREGKTEIEGRTRNPQRDSIHIVNKHVANVCLLHGCAEMHCQL